MKKLRVLITGGSGFLGQYLNIELTKEFEILTLFNINPGNCVDYNNALIDIRNPKALNTLFNRFKPDIVIHTACYSTPDLCSKLDKSEVLNLNVNATESISNLCAEYNSKLIFTSTDLVYKVSDIVITEAGELQPKSLYAETKIIGEEIIKKICPDFIILRTSLLYGIGLTHTKSHFEIILDSLGQHKNINLFFNQYRTPLEVNEASEIISKLITKDIKNETINFGGKERISRFEMGEIVCDVFGFDKKNLVKIDGEKILGDLFVSDVSMNTSKLQCYGINQNSIKENLIKIKKGSPE